MPWHPATIEDVKGVLKLDLKKCDAQQIATFQQYSVDPHFASILRYGEREQVVVVAEKSGEVMYWEDVEEGFNISPVGPDGDILEHWCNQDDLGIALNEWIEGRRKHQNHSPAKPLNS